MNELQIFNNTEFGQIRTVTIDNEPWFVASDIAKSLGYRMASDMTRRIDDEDKGTHLLRTHGGTQEMTTINESGLYSAIFDSKLPSAKKFKRWVTSEVLPTIRRTGSYARELTKDDYLKAAQIIASCKNDRLPHVLAILHQGGFELEKYNDDEFDIVELLNRYSLTELCRRLPFPKTSIYYYRIGKYKPSDERRKIIIETLN